MENFLRPLFEWMSENSVIINIIVLYGIPVSIFCVSLIIIVQNENDKPLLITGTILIITSLISLGVLSYYCIRVGFVGDGIFGVFLILSILVTLLKELPIFVNLFKKY